MDLMDLVAERTKILHTGVWKEKQVKILVKQGQNPMVTEEMEKIARARFAERKARNPKLFDGNILCLDLENSEVRPNSVLLVIDGSIKYSVYDAMRKEYIEKFGWKTHPFGMGMCVTIVSADSKILLHRTSPRVDFPNKISVIGGVYDSGTPFDCIRQEMKEEVGIKKSEIKEIRLLGISTRLEERRNYELNFYAKVFLSSEQIVERAKTAKDRYEGRIFFLDCSPKTLLDLLRENDKKITSTNFADLVLCGRYFWGKDWSRLCG